MKNIFSEKRDKNSFNCEIHRQRELKAVETFCPITCILQVHSDSYDSGLEIATHWSPM